MGSCHQWRNETLPVPNGPHLPHLCCNLSFPTTYVRSLGGGGGGGKAAVTAKLEVPTANLPPQMNLPPSHHHPSKVHLLKEPLGSQDCCFLLFRSSPLPNQKLQNTSKRTHPTPFYQPLPTNVRPEPTDTCCPKWHHPLFHDEMQNAIFPKHIVFKMMLTFTEYLLHTRCYLKNFLCIN